MSMEVKFGITDISREVSIETTATPDQIADQVRQAVVDASLVDLTDEKGHRVVVPVAKLAYVEIAASEGRRVGFGSS